MDHGLEWFPLRYAEWGNDVYLVRITSFVLHNRPLVATILDWLILLKPQNTVCYQSRYIINAIRYILSLFVCLFVAKFLCSYLIPFKLFVSIYNAHGSFNRLSIQV